MPGASSLPIVSIVVSAITTLGAPIIALFVAARMNRPKPTPEPKPAKNRIQRIGDWLLRVSASPWAFPPFGILLNLGTLPYEFRHANPVTGKTVFVISLTIAAIFTNLVFMFLFDISRIIGKMLDQDERRDATISRMIDIQGRLIERSEQASKRPKTKKPSKTSPLR
jgi:hypothetical protein